MTQCRTLFQVFQANPVLVNSESCVFANAPWSYAGGAAGDHIQSPEIIIPLGMVLSLYAINLAQSFSPDTNISSNYLVLAYPKSSRGNPPVSFYNDGTDSFPYLSTESSGIVLASTIPADLNSFAAANNVPNFVPKMPIPANFVIRAFASSVDGTAQDFSLNLYGLLLQDGNFSINDLVEGA